MSFEIIKNVANKKIKELEKNLSRKEAIKEVLDYTEEIMRISQPLVEEYLDERLAKGEIKDKNQARKTIAGNGFQFLVLYLLKLNQEEGNLDQNINILKTKKHPEIEKFAIIKVDNEVQKPDIDLIVFNEKKLIVYSCKTSLRERAGQTYKWKLLMDITQHCPKLVKKYNLKYSKEKEILTGFITPNFYNEINNPQQRGMLKFFDFAYIGKKIESDFIKPLSKIIDDLNSIFA